MSDKAREEFLNYWDNDTEPHRNSYGDNNGKFMAWIAWQHQQSIIDAKDEENYRLKVQSDGLMEASNVQHHEIQRLTKELKKFEGCVDLLGRLKGTLQIDKHDGHRRLAAEIDKFLTANEVNEK